MSTPSRRSRLEVENRDGIAIVNFIDRKIFDKETIQQIGEDLFSLVDQYERKKILLNFGKVEYLSSASLGKFLTLQEKLQKQGGKLVMCNINKDIFGVFEITRHDRSFNIQKDERAGLAEFSKVG